MKNTIKYLILLIIYLVCGVNLQAQNYTFRNVVMSDGLSGLLVNAIYKDSEGFVWLGTDNCLDRFDGVKVRHYEFRGVDSGRKKRVNSRQSALGGKRYRTLASESCKRPAGENCSRKDRFCCKYFTSGWRYSLYRYGERIVHPKGRAIAPSIDRPEYAGCL